MFSLAILKSTTAAIIIKLYEIVKDNGPQFVAEEFGSYLRGHGTTHHRVTPYWPQLKKLKGSTEPLRKQFALLLPKAKIGK